jgi:hypothetical protein
MRRLLAMLALAVGAMVFVPASSASADTFVGACTISGSASFPPPGLQSGPQDLDYSFNSVGGGPLSDSCTGSLNGGAPATHAITANANGTGTLSCEASVSTGGSASVAFVGGPTFNFTIDLVGTGSEVNFVIHDNGTPPGAGVGHATFAEEITKATECASGITSIGFDVVATAVKLTN